MKTDIVALMVLHRGLPHWRGGGAYASRTQRICNLEVRSQLRAEPMVIKTILHVTSAKWLVNFRLQHRLWLHSRLRLLCYFSYIGVALPYLRDATRGSIQRSGH